MKIDTKNWKYFEFDKIFFIKKGFYNKKPEPSGYGTIPFLGASDKNHGITDYYTIEEIADASKTGKGKNVSLEKKLFPAHAVCVTNNGSVGYAYYMDKQFTCSHDVNPLYKKDGEFNFYTGMFIASIIMNDRYRWGYGRKWRPIRMQHSRIKLPILMSGVNPIIDNDKKFSEEGYIPDWKYMENYIKSLNCKVPKTNNDHNKRSLDTCRWQKFYLRDIFNMSMGNGIDATIVTTNDPKYNYVTRNRNNNGVVNFVDAVEGEEPFKPGNMTLALGGTYLGSCFIQNKEFYTGQNVAVLTPKEKLSRYSMLFIAAIIRNECSIKHQAFGRELNSHFKKDFTLKLPVKKDNKDNFIIDKDNLIANSKGYVPDWQFMEDYIKSLPNGDLI